MRRLDYNRLSDEQSFNGWPFDTLVSRLAGDAAKLFGQCGCTNDRACVHAAAASLDGLFRIINHPDDCPECAEINARRTEAEET